MSVISVDFVTDPVCPWCWLGLRYWDAARALVPNIEVEFGGGPSDRFKAMRAHLEAAGPDAGIVFNFDEIPMRPNTLDAHRLVRWAQGQDIGEPVLDAVHKAFFEERRDIGDPQVLTEIAVANGMEEEIVTDLLASDKDAGAILTEERFYRSLGVQGVPCFIFNGRFAVSGAEAPSVLADAIKKAASLPPAEDR
jgi:predicted DsbA family dithiol-disulfide isomerase